MVLPKIVTQHLEFIDCMVTDEQAASTSNLRPNTCHTQTPSIRGWKYQNADVMFEVVWRVTLAFELEKELNQLYFLTSMCRDSNSSSTRINSNNLSEDKSGHTRGTPFNDPPTIWLNCSRQEGRYVGLLILQYHALKDIRKRG